MGRLRGGKQEDKKENRKISEEGKLSHFEKFEKETPEATVGEAPQREGIHGHFGGLRDFKN